MHPERPTAAGTLSSQAFGRLAHLIYRHSRVRLGPEKRLMLSNRLRSRISQLGLPSGDAYAQHVESVRHSQELDVLIDLATTHYTQFMREPAHFEWLVSDLLPTWRTRQADGGIWRIWSAATSSGEEAWTLAMLLAEASHQTPNLLWHLEATDISGRMLDRARRAIYPERALDPVSHGLRRRYFQRGIGSRLGSCRVVASLRERVRFTQSNLFDDPSVVTPGQHLIFCRNVMIYFDEESRNEAVRRLVQHMAPGGHLVIGSSESLLRIEHGLKAVKPGIYQLP